MAWRKRVARGAKPPHFICTSRGENKRRCGLLLLLLLLVLLLLVLLLLLLLLVLPALRRSSGATSDAFATSELC